MTTEHKTTQGNDTPKKSKGEGLPATQYNKIRTLLRTKYPEALQAGINTLATIQEEHGYKDARSPDNLENLENHIIHVYAHGGVMRYTLRTATGPEVFLSTWSKKNKTFNVESRRQYRVNYQATIADQAIKKNRQEKAISPTARSMGWPDWRG